MYTHLYMGSDIYIHIHIYIYVYMERERENDVFTITFYVNLGAFVYDNSL